jgi:Na+/H+ antiporter NhaC
MDTAIEIIKWIFLIFGIWIMLGAVVVVLYNIAKHLPQISDWIWWRWFKIKRWYNKQSYESRDTNWDRDHPAVQYEIDHRQENFD